MGLLTRWQEYVRQYGTMGLLRHLVARMVRPVWETNSALLLTLEPPAPVVKAKVPLKIALIATKGPEGHLCYGAWYAGARVHHSWVSFSDTRIAEIDSTIRLEPGEAYIYDCFTDGSTRGKRIFPAVLSHIAQELFAQGCRRIWIAVEEENRSSLKAIERAGFRRAAEVSYRRLGAHVILNTEHVPGSPVPHLSAPSPDR